MIRFLCALALLLCAATPAVAQPLIWNTEALNRLRETHAAPYAEIVGRAAKACQQKPLAVTQKARSVSGDKHNFESLSIYYWPDPEHPGGPYVCRDGEYNPEYKDYDLPVLNRMKERLQLLAMAYHLTGNVTYFRHFCTQLDTWFLDPQTRMTPHFEYGQMIPGRNGGKGCAAGLIDAYAFVEVLESIRLVDSQRAIGRSRSRALRKWFADFAQWMQDSEIGQRERAARNNHGLAYDVLLFRIAHYTKDKATMEAVARNFVNSRMAAQIDAEGKQPLELARTRAMHYSVFNLSHIMDFKTMLANLGTDLGADGERMLRAALAYAAQYIGHQGDFPYKETGDWTVAEQKLKKEICRYSRLADGDNLGVTDACAHTGNYAEIVR